MRHDKAFPKNLTLASKTEDRNAPEKLGERLSSPTADIICETLVGSFSDCVIYAHFALRRLLPGATDYFMTFSTQKLF